MPNAVERPALPRSAVVWGAFAAASALAIGVLWAGSPSRRPAELRSSAPTSEPPVSSLAGASVVAAPAWRNCSHDATMGSSTGGLPCIRTTRCSSGSLSRSDAIFFHWTWFSTSTQRAPLWWMTYDTSDGEQVV